VNSLILSRLHFCASILNGVSKQELLRLQRIINAAARLTTGKKRTDLTNTIIREYGWLSIEQLIALRSSSLIHNVLSTGQPVYLASLLHHPSTQRSLRSSEQGQLSILRVGTAAGSRAFSCFAPLIWNSIPQRIRETKSHTTFCALLQEHLIDSQIASPSWLCAVLFVFSLIMF